MSRFHESIDQVRIADHLDTDPDEGTKRYKAARARSLASERAATAHGRLTAEVERHVDRKRSSTS